MTSEHVPTATTHGATTGATRRDPSYTGRIWTWRLLGLSDPRLDAAITAVAFAALVLSRFALLPSGPWELDETLFSRGLLRFDLPSHFPHPPGFPLWMALGRLILDFVPEPLRGFQLLSAAASCLTLFPLSALARRAAPAPAAALAAFVALFVPGVWLHAGRGFNDTTAAFLAFWAAALAVWGLDGRRVHAFTLLVAAAFLVRPVLLPEFGLLWLAGALGVRPRKRLVPGVAAGAAATAAAVAGLVLAQGSWARFVSAFAKHAANHVHNLEVNNQGGVLDLGIVKGLGGGWLAAAAAVLAVIGILAWARRVGRSAAVAWGVILSVTVVQLVWLQGRTSPRYAAPLQEAVAPLLAAAASAVAPPLVALGGLAALGAAWGVAGVRPVLEQHRTLMPGWAAVQAAVRDAKGTGETVVVEPGLFPFLSYQDEMDRAAGAPWKFPWTLAPSSPDSRSLPTGTYILLTEYPFHYFPGFAADEARFGGVSDALRRLSQGRFLNGLAARDVPLPVRGWWLPEVVPDTGEKFMWGGKEAEVLVPPLPAGSGLVVDCIPYGGPAPLELLVDGAPALAVPGDAPRATRTLDPRLFPENKTTRLVFRRAEAYEPGNGDTRKLSVQLWGMKPQRP